MARQGESDQDGGRLARLEIDRRIGADGPAAHFLTEPGLGAGARKASTKGGHGRGEDELAIEWLPTAIRGGHAHRTGFAARARALGRHGKRDVGRRWRRLGDSRGRRRRFIGFAGCRELRRRIPELLQIGAGQVGAEALRISVQECVPGFDGAELLCRLERVLLGDGRGLRRARRCVGRFRRVSRRRGRLGFFRSRGWLVREPLQIGAGQVGAEAFREIAQERVPGFDGAELLRRVVSLLFLVPRSMSLPRSAVQPGPPPPPAQGMSFLFPRRQGLRMSHPRAASHRRGPGRRGSRWGNCSGTLPKLPACRVPSPPRRPLSRRSRQPAVPRLASPLRRPAHPSPRPPAGSSVSIASSDPAALPGSPSG